MKNVSSLWQKLKPIVDSLRDYWPLLGTLGLGAYVVAVRDKLMACATAPCTAWVAMPLLIVGGVTGYALARALARRRQRTVAFEHRHKRLSWSRGANAGVPVTHLSGEWYVTNLQPGHDNLIVGVEIESPAGGDAFIMGEPVAMPAGRVTTVNIFGTLPREAARPGKPIDARLVFRDAGGGRHAVRARFLAPPGPAGGTDSAG